MKNIAEFVDSMYIGQADQAFACRTTLWEARMPDFNESTYALVAFRPEGNVVPASWYHHIKYPSGKPHLIAITLLSDIVYWFRPIEERDEDSGETLGWRQRFTGDALCRSYEQWGERFGFSKRETTDALKFLVAEGFITTELRTVRRDGVVLNNILHITSICAEKLFDITYRLPRRYPSTAKPTRDARPTRPYAKTQGGVPFQRKSHIYKEKEINKRDSLEESVDTVPDIPRAQDAGTILDAPIDPPNPSVERVWPYAAKLDAFVREHLHIPSYPKRFSQNYLETADAAVRKLEVFLQKRQDSLDEFFYRRYFLNAQRQEQIRNADCPLVYLTTLISYAIEDMSKEDAANPTTSPAMSPYAQRDKDGVYDPYSSEDVKHWRRIEAQRQAEEDRKRREELDAQPPLFRLPRLHLGETLERDPSRIEVRSEHQRFIDARTTTDTPNTAGRTTSADDDATGA